MDGNRLYNPGDLIDYHRPTATKDEHGGWNGPFPVVRNEPDRGQVICTNGSREITVQYPDARHTLFTEVLVTTELGMDNDAMHLIPQYIADLPAGKYPQTFGYVLMDNGYILSTMSQRAPKLHLALQ